MFLAHPTTTTAPPTTTAAPPTTTTTTTTTAPTAPEALADLVGDVASGESSGAVASDVGQNISNQAEQAITDESSGKPNQAANDLQQAAMAISNGEQHGKINPTFAQVLGSDLVVLANALGLGAAAAAPTTTDPAAPGPASPTAAPPHGHGGPKAGGGPQGDGP